MNENYESVEFSAVKRQIAQRCAFDAGRALLMAQMPRFDTLWIRRELRRCAQASALLRVHLQFPDEDILDISAHLQRADKGMTLRPGELYAIVRFIRTCARVRKFLGHCDEEMEELRELRDALIDEHRLEKEVARCISQDGDVFDHASAQLASLRQRRGELSAMISEEARRFISAHKDILMDTITAIRGGRTCVLVKVSEKNSTRGIVHGESASGQAVYLEPGALVSLNNRLQALESEEQQEVERILSGLSAKVREEADELSANLDTMTLLDVIFAKAAWCNANDGCVASLNTQDAHLLLKEARHPLIPAASVVANTYEMREPRRRLLISGSNTGGKTVTLKTIALFVILTHAGFPVLCERAIVPFYQRILLDVGDQQSIQESLSTFSSHLSRLASICELADARSFIILDELGSGTDPAEGECLAIAILEELGRRHSTLVASTHFARVKTYAAACDDMMVSCVAFDMETMTPTYHYLEGVSGQSNAFAIARRYHLSAAIVDRAQQLKQEGQSEEASVMERLERQLQQVNEEKERLHARLDEVQQLRRDLLREQEKLRRRSEDAVQKAYEQARESYEERMQQAEQIIRELRDMKADHKPHEVSQKLHQLREMQPDQRDPEATSPVDEEIKVGDYVRLRRLNYHGEVISLSKNKAVVLANGMKMNVKCDELEKMQPPEKKKEGKGYRKPSSSSFPLECNVIGMHVDEALAVVDKYLDNALLNKASSVRIIHGMGTGALRKAVHAYLKRNVNVESFRMGAQGEGGLGATVVELKQKGKKHG